MGKDGQPWWEEAISISIVTCLCSELVIWSKYQDILIEVQLSNDELKNALLFCVPQRPGSWHDRASLPEYKALAFLSSLSQGSGLIRVYSQ